MTRLLVVGASDISALKLAKPEIEAEHPDWQIDFFGLPFKAFDLLQMNSEGVFCLVDTPGPGRAQVARKARELVNKINGRDAVRFDDYDVVLYVHYVSTARKLKETLLRCDVEGITQANRAGLMSQSAFRAVATSLAGGLALPPSWSKTVDTKFAVMDMPLTSATCQQSSEPKYTLHQKLAATGADFRGAFKIFTDGARKVLADAGTTFIAQPVETITPALLTEAEYSWGSRRLVDPDAEHPEDDTRHMNGKFGAACLRSLIQATA